MALQPDVTIGATNLATNLIKSPIPNRWKGFGIHENLHEIAALALRSAAAVKPISGDNWNANSLQCK